MNLKTMFGLGLLAFGTALAQDGYEYTSTEQSMSERELQKQEEQAAASSDIAAPVPFVAPSIPPESKRSSFNQILHGKAYNRNGNMAAANNTDLLLNYPNLFANRKFFYIEPTNKMGILSLGSFFAAFDNSNAILGETQVGRLTVGYAVLGFGFYIRAGLGHSRIENESPNAVKVAAGKDSVDVEPGLTSTTIGGDDWAFAISKGFMGYNLALSGDWVTKKNQVYLDLDNGLEREERLNTLTLKLNLTNAPIAKNLTWTAGVQFVNYLNEVEVNSDVVSNADPLLVDESDVNSAKPSYWELAPYLRGGLSVLENENARVLFGLGAIGAYRHYDDPQENFSITAILQPSMMGEVFIGENKNFMLFGEVGYTWVAFTYGKDDKRDVTQMAYNMNPVDAAVGARYQYKDFLAFELGLGQKLFSDAGAFFNGQNTFIDFSAMVRF